MLTVAYIGNFVPAHSTENEVRRALEALGHTVLQLQEGATRFSEVAQRLRERSKPDLLLWTRTGDLCAQGGSHAEQLQMLDDLRAMGVPSVAYHLDRWWGLNREGQVHSEPFFRCDLVCSADGGHESHFRGADVNHRWFPPAISEFETEPGRWREGYASEIAFVGTWRVHLDDNGQQVGYHAEWSHRRELIEWLRKHYDGRLKLWPRGRAVRGRVLADVYASTKVVVGDSCLVGGATHYWSDRIPETLGRRAFLLHPHVEGLSDHFVPGVHLDTWQLGDWDELHRRIEHYVVEDDHRQLIAEAGWEHVREHHTYTVRMRQLVDLLRDEGLL